MTSHHSSKFGQVTGVSDGSGDGEGQADGVEEMANETAADMVGLRLTTEGWVSRSLFVKLR